MLDRDTMLILSELFMSLDHECLNQAADVLPVRELMCVLAEKASNLSGDSLHLFNGGKTQGTFNKSYAALFLAVVRFYLVAPSDLQLTLRGLIEVEQDKLKSIVEDKLEIKD